MLRFIREVSIDNLTPDMIALEAQGDYTLKWKEDSIEIWGYVAVEPV